MAYLKDIIKINSEDYNTLASTGSVTISGTTYNYDNNNLYLTEKKQPQLYRHITKYKIYTSSSSYNTFYLMHVNNDSDAYPSQTGHAVLITLMARSNKDTSTYYIGVQSGTTDITFKYAILCPITTSNGVLYINNTGSCVSIGVTTNANNQLISDIVKPLY